MSEPFPRTNLDPAELQLAARGELSNATSPLSTSEVIEAAKAELTAAGLSIPYVPPEMCAALKKTAEWNYSTRDDVSSLYVQRELVDEFVRGESEPYVAFGYDGHGRASNAFGYVYVCDPIGIFVQSAWNGLPGDAALEVRRALHLAADVVKQSHQLQAVLKRKQ